MLVIGRSLKNVQSVIKNSKNKFKFVTEVFAMKGIKIELLGIATILLGIAVTTNNFSGYVLGFLGFGVAVAGSFKNSILINCTTTYQKISSPLAKNE